MRALSVTLLLSLLPLATPGVPSTATAHRVAAPAGAPAAQSPRTMPTLHVRRQVRGLSHPWDVQSVGHGRILVTERDTARLLTWHRGTTRRVRFPSSRVWVSGETGLMSLAVDPNFSRNRRFYTCQGGYRSGGTHDVRVMAWRLDATATRARSRGKLIGGFPSTSGRHGGCRLLILRNGALLVGTGDSAQGAVPENLRSLGGKTLRLNRFTGAPWPGNPFVHATNRNKRYIHTYGHRNVQGLGQRPDGTLWSIEQGTYRDDEVNLLVNGGDYGYNPVPGYNEDVPMTDQSLPGTQVAARWSSGDPTLATSGGTWVTGSRWGTLNGTFAVAALKAGRIVFLKFDRSGHLLWTRQPAALQRFGRLRSVTQAPNGDLWVTTDNGDGADSVLRVSPR